jgi:hypothetical protein
MNGYKSFQTKYLFPWPTSLGSPNILQGQNPAQEETVVRQMRDNIMKEYNFIGIVERMEESLAVLVLLLRLEPADVVVLSAKRAGGYDDGEGEYGKCVKIAKQPPHSRRSAKVLEYLYHEHAKSNADFLLYDAVNQSLDKTIESLGAKNVQKTINQIRELQKLAEERCQDKAFFPCSNEGVFQAKLAKESCVSLFAKCLVVRDDTWKKI